MWNSAELQDIEVSSAIDCLDSAIGAKLVVDLAGVPFDGINGEIQVLGNGFVGKTISHQVQNLFFPLVKIFNQVGIRLYD